MAASFFRPSTSSTWFGSVDFSRIRAFRLSISPAFLPHQPPIQLAHCPRNTDCWPEGLISLEFPSALISHPHVNEHQGLWPRASRWWLGEVMRTRRGGNAMTTCHKQRREYCLLYRIVQYWRSLHGRRRGERVMQASQDEADNVGMEN